MHLLTHYDVLVIGSGPAGQKAAVQAAKAGRSVAVIEREQAVGGACVSRGTIPSKSLRESALRAIQVRNSGELFDGQLRSEIELGSLMSRVDSVITAHASYMARQLERNRVTLLHGRARFVTPHEVEVRSVSGFVQRVSADIIAIATGSRPRTPPEVPVDHENILDSDSILSMVYLPASLCVLGSGVIASEYASIFANLGVRVTLVDKADRPLRFMDEELVKQFVTSLERTGGVYLGGRTLSSIAWDGVSQVACTFGSAGSGSGSGSGSGRETVRAEKVLVALGRSANLEGLELANAGLAATTRGLIEVDANCRTIVPHIYAVGDVIGPPALAATSMEQGRRAICHALGLPQGNSFATTPIGIYTVPEMASVGLSVEEARKSGFEPVIGRARFDEVARGQISWVQDGLLKLVADADGKKLLGVHIVGEGACELIHLGQIAIAAGWEVDGFVEHIFNFPTLAEAYRVAALDVVGKRSRLAAPHALVG